ncbi:O-methyltransferase [Mycena olivaceomarginata]|nr:O-methyltransferase [Mycena olivaceomarginata]
MDSPSSLRQLSNIIAQAVTYIEAEYAKASAPLPSLDESFDPTTPAEAVGMKPAAFAASSMIIAAAAQITATVSNPALAIINNSSVGIHVQEIAKRSRTDPDKLARVLRLLATHHIFGEITPDVFHEQQDLVRNRQMEAVRSPLRKAAEKFTGTSGLGEFLEHLTDEGFKSSAYMTDALLDPATASSQEPTVTPFSRTFSTDAPLFAWYESPENKDRLARFGIGQARTTKLYPPDAILLGFEWDQLPMLTMPSLNIVIQNRAPVIEQSKAYGAEHFKSHVDPVWLNSKLIKNADVFLLRQIVHDWPDGAVIKILAQLRAAATPTTKLIIVDQIIPYATTSDAVNSILGTARPAPPAPLLSNMGAASAVPYWADMTMYALVNGRERTMGGFVDICGQAGWKIVQVYHLPGLLSSEIVAAPG